jgi:hypothetical protein
MSDQDVARVARNDRNSGEQKDQKEERLALDRVPDRRSETVFERMGGIAHPDLLREADAIAAI